jgi:Autophagy protein ATG9
MIPHGLSKCVLLGHANNRLSYTGTFVLWAFALFWMIKFIQYVVDIQRLRELQSFYYHLLEIREVPQFKMKLIIGRHSNCLVARCGPEIDETPEFESKYRRSNEKST